MILTGSEIDRQVQKGNITISPFSSKQLNPNSYNYRLADTLLEFDQSIIEPKMEHSPKSIQIPVEGYLLLPGKLYLGSTVEVIGSEIFVTSLIGRSSVGRLGLFLQITADMGNLGAAHCWTLELKTVQPLVVYPHMKIGQVSFWKTTGTRKQFYKKGYDSYSLPTPSKLHTKLS
jgi:dCTP deaminase